MKEFLGGLAIILTLVAFFPYLRSITSGSTRPHVFSWVIWGMTTLIVFLAAVADNAGAGAWPIGVSAAITFGIAVLAYRKRGDISVTAVDWLFLAGALSTLPLWFFTRDPMWAVIVLTVVDLLGFGPTVRKVWIYPHSESLSFFGLFAFRNGIVLAALENYSVTTVLFPAAIAVACVCLLALVGIRRRTVAYFGERA